MKRMVFGLIGVGLLVGACSSDREPQKTLTERERDSTIARSDLPGAGTVGKALEISDSTAVRARRMETGP